MADFFSMINNIQHISRIEKGQHKTVTPATTRSFFLKIVNLQKALDELFEDTTPNEVILTRQLLEMHIAYIGETCEARNKLEAVDEVAALMVNEQKQLLRQVPMTEFEKVTVEKSALDKHDYFRHHSICDLTEKEKKERYALMSAAVEEEQLRRQLPMTERDRAAAMAAAAKEYKQFIEIELARHYIYIEEHIFFPCQGVEWEHEPEVELDLL